MKKLYSIYKMIVPFCLVFKGDGMIFVERERESLEANIPFGKGLLCPIVSYRHRIVSMQYDASFLLYPKK